MNDSLRALQREFTVPLLIVILWVGVGRIPQPGASFESTLVTVLIPVVVLSVGVLFGWESSINPKSRLLGRGSLAALGVLVLSVIFVTDQARSWYLAGFFVISAWLLIDTIVSYRHLRELRTRTTPDAVPTDIVHDVEDAIASATSPRTVADLTETTEHAEGDIRIALAVLYIRGVVSLRGRGYAPRNLYPVRLNLRDVVARLVRPLRIVGWHSVGS